MTRAIQHILLAFLVSFLLIGCDSSDMKPEHSGTDFDSKNEAGNFNSIGWNSNSEHTFTDSGKKQHTPVFPRSPAPSHLTVYNYYNDSFEMKLLLATLQGLVAKTDPRIYLIYDSVVDTFWLDEMVDHYGVTYDTAADGWDLVSSFASEVSGLVIYDPDLPASANLAATIAGINNGIVAAPSLLPQLQPYGFSVIKDLRGNFADNVEMYEWAMTNIWPQSNQTILCFTDPSLPTLRDYIVAHNIFAIMLDQHIPAERELLEQILADTPPDIPILGWAIDELLGVIIFSQGSKFHVASDWARNMSVTSGLPMPTLTQDHAGPFGEIENKTYISFAYTDGDNVAYTLDAMWHKWNDPARGQIPLGWEISFNVIDLAPQSIRYYYETRTDNDMFIGPACGIGYIYPRHYPDLDRFIELTLPYMEAADMDTIWLINDNLTFADEYAVAYSKGLNLSGIFIDYWANLDKGFYFASDTTPVLRSQYVYLIGPEQIPKIIEDKKIEKDYLYPNSPFFLFIGVNGWVTTPTYIKNIIDGLSNQYVVLRPDQMFAAMDRAYEEGYRF